ncbi:hypothetical protein [Janibacter alittae]|uniref:Uncharacterized protein n=1 Tax=Janibacter alittae TaxID=3115209 RepID=A0ABZ2MHS5_9MICO
MSQTQLNARRVILPYLATMVVLNILLQLGIAATGNRIDLTAALMTAVVAVVYALYHWRRRHALSQIRFGRLVAHLCGFITVNLGFHIHAAVLIVGNEEAIRGDANFPIDDQWFGVLFGMFVIWGVGLLIHLTASIASRGFEDLHA